MRPQGAAQQPAPGGAYGVPLGDGQHPAVERREHRAEGGRGRRGRRAAPPGTAVRTAGGGRGPGRPGRPHSRPVPARRRARAAWAAAERGSAGAITAPGTAASAASGGGRRKTPASRTGLAHPAGKPPEAPETVPYGTRLPGSGQRRRSSHSPYRVASARALLQGAPAAEPRRGGGTQRRGQRGAADIPSCGRRKSSHRALLALPTAPPGSCGAGDPRRTASAVRSGR